MVLRAAAWMAVPICGSLAVQTALGRSLIWCPGWPTGALGQPLELESRLGSRIFDKKLSIHRRLASRLFISILSL